MKKLLNVCLILFLSVAAFAATIEPPLFQGAKIIASKEAKKINVYYKEFQGDNVTIQLMDSYGAVLRTEKVKGNVKYAKAYNLDQMPTGDYKIVFKDNLKESIQPFTISDAGKVIVNRKEASIIYNPAVRLKGKVMDLNMLYFSTDENINIQILDVEWGSLHTEKVKNTSKLERRYDLSELGRGDYTLKIETKHKTIYKDFSL